ncbi:hypothetical protein J6590_102252 [Homalodisca vitripennis]|nr:hypothetical protein J6590_102252 [Homalodisca vitripennis]
MTSTVLVSVKRLGLESDNNQSHMYQLAARTLKESKCVHFSTAHHSQGFFKQLKNLISCQSKDGGIVHIALHGPPTRCRSPRSEGRLANR